MRINYQNPPNGTAELEPWYSLHRAAVEYEELTTPHDIAIQLAILHRKVVELETMLKMREAIVADYRVVTERCRVLNEILMSTREVLGAVQWLGGDPALPRQSTLEQENELVAAAERECAKMDKALKAAGM